jgi:beta-fructofuranosidase
LEVSDIPFTISEESQACEIQAVIDLTSSDALQVVFSLKANDEYHLDLILDLEHQVVILDRNQADGWSRGITHTEIRKYDRNNLTLDIFIDRSSVEAFIEDYHTILSSNVFAADNQLKNTVYAVGGTCVLKKLKTFQMSAGK